MAPSLWLWGPKRKKTCRGFPKLWSAWDLRILCFHGLLNQSSISNLISNFTISRLGIKRILWKEFHHLPFTHAQSCSDCLFPSLVVPQTLQDHFYVWCELRNRSLCRRRCSLQRSWSQQKVVFSGKTLKDFATKFIQGQIILRYLPCSLVCRVFAILQCLQCSKIWSFYKVCNSYL